MTKRTSLTIVAAALAFGFGFISQAQERFDLKVRNDFFAGFGGDKEALDRGMKACETELASNPKSPEALVWHGGGLFVMSRQYFMAGDQAKGMELWQQALQEMDSAVAIAPDRVGVRVPRGAVLLTASHYVPAQMARPLIDRGIADYEKTLELQKDVFSDLGKHPRGELLFGLAEAYSRTGEQAKAQAIFERIQAELPDTGYARRAAVWMETKSLSVAQTGCIGCHTGK